MKHLKQFLSVLTFVAITHSGFAQHKGRLIGEWVGADNTRDTASFIFDSSGHAFMKRQGQIKGGDNYKSDSHGTICELKYEVDSSKSPIWLDLVVYQKDDHKEIMRIKGIIKFLSNTKMLYRTEFNGSRSDSFDPKDDKYTVVLTKVEK